MCSQTTYMREMGKAAKVGLVASPSSVLHHYPQAEHSDFMSVTSYVLHHYPQAEHSDFMSVISYVS